MRMCKMLKNVTSPASLPEREGVGVATRGGRHLALLVRACVDRKNPS